jgi:selenoprotein W-related protein
LASRLLGTFKQRITALEMVPSGGGCFEVDLDGRRIYSKNETGDFPDEEEIVKLVEQQL